MNQNRIFGIFILFILLNMSQVMGTSPYDIDGNGVVDIKDLEKIGLHFNELVNSYPGPDVGGNGMVDILDMVFVTKHLGEITPKPIFNGDFENGTWSPPWTTSCNGDDDFQDFSIVTNPVRQGNYSAKIRVDSTSYCGGTTGNRFELLSSTFTDLKSEREGDEYWYAMSMMLDPSWTSASTDTGFHIFTQWHGPTRLSPELALNIWNTGGRPSFGYTMCTGNSPATPTSTSNCDYRTNEIFISPVEKNVWYDFLLHVKWTTSSTGYVEIWTKKYTEATYTQLVDLHNVPTLQKITGETSMVASRHIGLYRSEGYPDTDILYFDKYKMGTTRDSVT